MTNSDSIITNVRLANRSDYSQIIEFNKSMALETENIILDNDQISDGVIAVFEDPNLGRYLIATIHEEIVGGLLLTLEWSDWHNKFYWWIQSVYIKPE
jgi:hypothetical protein